MKTKVLITGASGLLGKAVLKVITKRDEYQVYAITTSKAKLQSVENVIVYECDLRDSVAVENMMCEIMPDTVIHLAWPQTDKDFRMSHKNVDWLEISLNILRCFQKCNGHKFVFAGSSSEYDGEDGFFGEHADIVPDSVYGLAKKTFNKFAEEYCSKFNIQYIGMRVFTIYGISDTHKYGAIPNTISKLLKGENVICNQPNTIRDYIYVDDVARITLGLMESTFSGIINVASGTGRSMRQVFESIGRIMNCGDKISYNEENKNASRLEADITKLTSLCLNVKNDLFEEHLKKIIEEKSAKEYDLIVAGCGFAGSTIAYLAAKAGKKVLMVEKRNHIAGNMYDYQDDSGILVQKYGPHSFHTNNEDVYRFIASIGEWEEYILRARVFIDGKFTPSPFNFTTIEQYFDEEKAQQIEEHLKAAYPNCNKVTIVELLNSDDSIIREYAEFLFEKDYRPYTAKQWGINPDELDISILKRVPVRLDYTDGYFDDKYQLIPKGGFTKIIGDMINQDNIDLILNSDINEHISFEPDGTINCDLCGTKNTPLVYTGPLDELFKLKYGRLPYRSLYFDLQTHDVDSYQPTSGVAYPMAEGYTRITEYKKLPIQNIPGKTTIAVEYPEVYGSERGKEPYYPILTNDSQTMYCQYKEEANKYNNLFLCGRLAEFKYYNMDQVIERALQEFQLIFSSTDKKI